MGNTNPFIFEIAPETYAINEFGLSTMYLLVGQKKALLIDTGCGVCDVKSIIHSLTEKPYCVVITHGHFDHVGGMSIFDEVYLNARDHELAKTINCEEVCMYADKFGKGGGYQIYDYDINEIKEIIEYPKFLPLNDGDHFDLGGRVIESFEIQGHTEGGITFLDVNNRIMFSGDCCNTNLLAFNCSIETTLKGLHKFKLLSERFDQNFNGHIGYMGSTICLSQPKTVADDLIDICESVLRHEGTPQQYDFLGYKLTQMSFGSAKLSYNPERLTEGEK